MEKDFVITAKKAQIALAVMAAIGSNFVGMSNVFAVDSPIVTSRAFVANYATNSAGDEQGVATASGAGALAAGNKASAKQSNTVAIGNNANAGISVTDLNGNYDVITNGEFYKKNDKILSASEIEGKIQNIDYLLEDGQYFELQLVDMGLSAIAVGHDAIAISSDSVAIGNGAQAIAVGAVAIGANTVNSEINTVAVGSRRITQVAEATKNTDAVNLSQVITNIAKSTDGSKLNFYIGDSTTNTTAKWSIDLPASSGSDVTMTADTFNKMLQDNLAQKGSAGNTALAAKADSATVNAALENKADKNGGNIVTNGTAPADQSQWADKLGIGEVVQGDKDLVNSNTVYSELRPQNGEYVKQANTTAANLKALDTHVKNNADNIGNMGDLAIIDKNGNVANSSLVAAVNAVNGKVDKNTDSIGYVSDLGDKYKGIVDLDGNLIGSGGSGYKVNLTDGLLAVDERVGNLNPNGQFVDEETGEITGKYNVLDGKESLAGNMEAVDKALGDVSSFGIIKKLDGTALDSGNDDADVSVAEAVNTVNDKVGDLTADGDNIKKGKSVSENIALLDSAVGKTIDGAYVSSTKSIAENLNSLDNHVATNTNSINRLDNKVNKVGAGAAALASLHPLDFDPDDKLTFAAGFGNYQGENAVALGAFYRPDEKVMFSMAGNMGNGENMINAGVSFALDRTYKTTTSKAVMAKKIEAQNEKIATLNGTVEEQKQALAEQGKEIAKLRAMVEALAAKK